MCFLHPCECVCLRECVCLSLQCVCVLCAHIYVHVCMHVFVKGEAGRVCVFGRVWTVFPDSSAVKNLPLMQETQEMQVQFLGQEEPLEKEMATYSNILP